MRPQACKCCTAEKNELEESAMNANAQPIRIVCASNLLAFQIEVALDVSTAFTERLVARVRIQALLKYLQEVGLRWCIAKWTSRVYELVVRRAGLMLADTESQGNIRPNNITAQHEPLQPLPNSDFSGQQISDFPFEPNPGSNVNGISFDVDQLLPDLWMQDFVGESFFGQINDSIFGYPQV
jgi:hypothetical protein